MPKDEAAGIQEHGYFIKPKFFDLLKNLEALQKARGVFEGVEQYQMLLKIVYFDFMEMSMATNDTKIRKTQFQKQKK
jgi:hypothetical protein